ncbi:DUF6400 family protein [Streptomyces cyaneofuscatus]|uniref:DUF6400 family protein n=1 Tax=Streptomyces cyaneofuscatus TaxID=66883 RepID=UPI003982A96C
MACATRPRAGRIRRTPPRTHNRPPSPADWDPMAALRSEDEAYALLYSGLDAEQQRTYDRLVAAGVLPGEDQGRAAAR